MTKLTFKLTKAASKKGGDRYETPHGKGSFVIYFPQEISRVDGKPKATITLTIE